MASRPPRVVAIGDGIVDLVTPPMEDFAPGDVQAEVPRFDPLPGGNATNFALQMSSLGASTTFIGAVGSDSNAKLLRDRYREYGVRARLFVDPSRPTGSTMALTWSTGRRALVTNPGANARLRLSDVPLRAIRGVHHVHRSGFWWTSGLVGKPTATLLARARRLAGTSSTQRMRTRNWRGLPSANRCASRMPPPPFTCGIDDGRTRPSRRSAASFDDSPLPRQIFTFTYLPLRTPFIWPGGVPFSHGTDRFARAIRGSCGGVGDAGPHRSGSLHVVGLPVAGCRPSGCGRRVVQRRDSSGLRSELGPSVLRSR